MEKSKLDSNKLLALFSRHVVPMSFCFQENGKELNWVISGFIISCGDDWFFITAGHCLENIEKEKSKRNLQYQGSFFIDSLNPQAKDIKPLIFNYFDSDKNFLDNEAFGLDYGIIRIDPLSKRNLIKNGVVPLDEKMWKTDKRQFFIYAMCGIPTETTSYNNHFLHMSPYLFYVTPLNERPPELRNTKTPRFYGQVNINGEIELFEGMSGSPIFGVDVSDSGDIQYFLIAVQSGWYDKKQYIAGCFFSILGEVLEGLIQKNISSK